MLDFDKETFDLAIQEFNGEPRMRDIEIAEALGYEHPRQFRELIKRNLPRLVEFGEIICRTVRQINERGRDPKEYWLNEAQCFYICTQSKTDNAFVVTRQIITLFVDWKHGRITPPPQAALADDADLHPDAELWLSAVRTARLTYGKAAARKMWAKSPLPGVADDPLQDIHEPGSADSLIIDFIRECCEVTDSPHDRVTVSRLCYAFNTWSRAMGVPPWTSNAVSRRMTACSGAVKSPAGASFEKYRSNGETGWKFLRLREAAVQDD